MILLAKSAAFAPTVDKIVFLFFSMHMRHRSSHEASLMAGFLDVSGAMP